MFIIPLPHGKRTLIFGIRAIIEAIQAGKEVDRVFFRRIKLSTKPKHQ